MRGICTCRSRRSNGCNLMRYGGWCHRRTHSNRRTIWPITMRASPVRAKWLPHIRIFVSAASNRGAAGATLSTPYAGYSAFIHAHASCGSWALITSRISIAGGHGWHWRTPCRSPCSTVRPSPSRRSVHALRCASHAGVCAKVMQHFWPMLLRRAGHICICAGTRFHPQCFGIRLVWLRFCVILPTSEHP